MAKTYNGLIKEATKLAEERLKDGSLKEREKIGYIRGHITVWRALQKQKGNKIE